MGRKTDPVKDFNFSSFDKSWAELDQHQQCHMLDHILDLSCGDAFYPIMAGLLSYHYLLRNKARHALDIVSAKMVKALGQRDNKTSYIKALKESDGFASKIFFHIKTENLVSELNFYFKHLIKLHGKGPSYAWKMCISGMITKKTFSKISQLLSDEEKLLLTEQYTYSTFQIKREWALEFKKMMAGIEDINQVVDFFNDLFDQDKYIDPFLLNIPLLEKDDFNLLNNLDSFNQEKREKILKAASIIKDSLETDLMVSLLQGKNNKGLLITAMKIIERSAMDTYNQTPVVSQLLAIFENSDADKALCAFKALVVTRAVPLYSLFLKVVKLRKDILMDVFNEISSFSRISFLIIQDAALNKKDYLKHNALVFKAYILGIARMRPERVMGILKKFENYPDDEIRSQVSGFVKKISCFLDLEKRSLENQVKELIKQVNLRQGKSKGLIKSLFFSLTEKKILKLKEGRLQGRLDFEREIIENIDISGLNLLNHTVFFNGSIIKGSDFSNLIIAKARFQNSIIFNVDFTGSEFDSVCFDNAIMIDVKAFQAKFKNCSFKEGFIYDSGFKHCTFNNSTFTGAEIVRTDFKDSRFSGVSFTASKLSFVNFIDSVFTMSDFSCVRAKYSQFDDFVEPNINKYLADFNARTFKLNIHGIPDFNEEVITRLLLLVFVEFLSRGEKLFLKKNNLSKLIAFDVYKKKQGDLFELIPLLLHGNIPLTEKGSFIKNCPHGIKQYSPMDEVIKIAGQYCNASAVKAAMADEHGKACIEGVYTIGSTGSLAQTPDSDFDFWVVIKKKLLSEKMIKKLEFKLRQIEKWAAKRFDTEVNFFLLDITKALENDFGTLSFESSGSAQGRLLKEEFYRTVIYVAGKIPLWSVLPVSISVDHYHDINHLIVKSSLGSKYIDLGDIHGIPPGEYFGASIWHMYKLLKSPFKSVIKMALLEKFINGYGKEPLLCNKIKDIWINSESQLKLINSDSYYILINELIKFYKSMDDPKSVNLIQICFFLKVGISGKSDFSDTLFGIRKQFIKRLLNAWAMEEGRVFEIGNYKNWEYKAIERLSGTIENYMINKMRSMKTSFENVFQKEALITPEERTVLVRNIVVEFSRENRKIERVLLVSRSLNYFKRVSLQHVKKKRPAWKLTVDPEKSRTDWTEPLKTASTIEEIGAWLINNGFYDKDVIITLEPNPSHVTHNDIVRLFNAMHGFFSPIVQRQKSFKALLMKAEIAAVLVSCNLCSDRNDTKITMYTAVYINSWNEMFSVTRITNKGFKSSDDLIKDILNKLGIKKMPRKQLFIIPRIFLRKIDAPGGFFQ